MSAGRYAGVDSSVPDSGDAGETSVGGGKAEDDGSDSCFGDGGHEAIPEIRELRAGSFIEFITAARVRSMFFTEAANSSCVLCHDGMRCPNG